MSVLWSSPGWIFILVSVQIILIVPKSPANGMSRGSKKSSMNFAYKANVLYAKDNLEIGLGLMLHM